MKRHLTVALSVVFLFSGCASSGRTVIESFHIDQLQAIDATTLACDYHDLLLSGEMTESARDEVEAVLIEKGVSSGNIQAIRAQLVLPGMSQLEMYAAMGKARSENHTATGQIQHAFGSEGGDIRHVYTEDGQVVAGRLETPVSLDDRVWGKPHYPTLKELDAKARAIPAANARANLQAYEELLDRAPDSDHYRSKVDHYRRAVAQQLAAEQRRRRKNADLELGDWHWQNQHGHAIAEGQVTNISGTNLENVTAVVTFKTASGRFVTTGRAIVEFDPILPGQTSPWKTYATWNPEMASAYVEFKTMFGGKLVTVKQ